MSKLDGIKAGDRVRVTFEGVVKSTDDMGLTIAQRDIYYKTNGLTAGFNAPAVDDSSFQITRIEPAFKLGDEVKYLASGGRCTIVAVLSDGRLVVEYEAGDTTEVTARDPSCFTHA